MKLTLLPDARPTLHMETDDGLHIYGIVDLEPRKVDRRSIQHRLHSATGLFMAAMVATVNDMFRCAEMRRTNTPEVGARMRVKGGTGDDIVTGTDSDKRLAWLGGSPDPVAWAELEYAS